MDNQSAISVTQNPEHHGRLKHLDLCHYWLRHAVNDGLISTHYFPTKTMPADIMTKALGREMVGYGCDALGLSIG